MPAKLEEGLRRNGLLRSLGPHAPDTVRRRLTCWLILTRWRGVTGFFSDPSLKSALRLAVRAAVRPRKCNSRSAVTGEVMALLLATCAGNSLTDIRDRALLLTAFASSGRRRSELASLRIEDLVEEEPVRETPGDENSPLLPLPDAAP